MTVRLSGSPVCRLAAIGAAVLGLAAFHGCSRGAGTVTGRATIAGAGAPGAEVRFFIKAGEERTGTPFAVGTAGEDGAFRIELPPGTYFVVARKTVREGGRDRTYKGEHPGNPVAVVAAATSSVDVPLSEMSSGGFTPREGTGVTGKVTFAGRPAAGAFVYAYASDAKTVRGPSYVAFARTGGDGRFRLALREGAFLIVARRKGGESETGGMGPEGASGGDEGTPVALAAGALRDVGEIALHAPREESRRRRVQAGGQEKAAAEVRGTVARDDGAPAPGVYVMAYSDHRMIGRPFAISGRTGADGGFVIRLPRPGTFYIGARSEMGGPVSPGEWVGTYDAAPDHAVEVGRGEKKDGVRITVAEKW